MFPFRRKEYPKTCEVCGKKFVAYALRAKFCLDCREKVRHEYHKIYCREYRRTHLEYFRKKQREFYRAHHEKLLIYHRQYYRKNREFCRLNARIRYYDKCAASYYNAD